MAYHLFVSSCWNFIWATTSLSMVGGASCSVPPLCQWLVGLFFAYHLFVNGCWGFLWPATSLTIVDGASIGVPPLCKWMVDFLWPTTSLLMVGVGFLWTTISLSMVWIPMDYHLFVNGWWGFLWPTFSLLLVGGDSYGLPPLLQWVVLHPLCQWLVGLFLRLPPLCQWLLVLPLAYHLFVNNWWNFLWSTTSLSITSSASSGLPPLCQLLVGLIST